MSRRQEEYEYRYARWQQQAAQQRAKNIKKEREERERESERRAIKFRREQADWEKRHPRSKSTAKAANDTSKTRRGTTLIGDEAQDVEDQEEERPSFFARLLKLFGF